MAGSSRPEVARREFEKNAASAATHYRFPNKPFPHSMLLVFKEYDYSNFNNNNYSNLLNSAVDDTGRLIGFERGGSWASLRSARSIELPFPKQLQDTSNLLINGFSRDPLMEGITNKMTDFINGNATTLGDIPGMIQNAGADLASALASGSSGGLGAAINKIANQISGTSTANAASIAQYLMRSMLPGDLAKSVNLATGQVLNPRETLAFEGVGLRTHQFNWDLFPSNKEDSVRIKEIINIIKRSVLPTTQDIGTGQAGIAKAFLRYPHTVEIYLTGVADGYFMKFKPALVTNFVVDYGAGGTLAMLKGGKPAGVNISLSLQELQIETAEDYGEPSPEPVGANMANENAPVGYNAGQVDPALAAAAAGQQ